MENSRKNSSKTGSIGVPPVDKFKITERNLPHWQEPGSVYFISWHCREGNNLSSEARTITLESIRYWDESKWKVYAAVVMSDHVHILAQPLTLPDGSAFNLAEIIHSVKSFSAHCINLLRGRKGPFWQQERYDRIVRDEAEFLEKWQYIRNNPVKQELAERPEEYPWFYERG
jgi:putative transposase